MEVPYRELAFTMLENAKDNLRENDELMPVVIAKIGDQLQVIGMKFTDTDKYSSYRTVWNKLLPRNPEVIITINDTYCLKLSGKEDLSHVRQGSLGELFQLGDPDVSEAIVLMVYPRGKHAWMVQMPYKREKDGITFDEPKVIENESGKELGGDLGPEQWLRAGNRSMR